MTMSNARVNIPATHKAYQNLFKGAPHKKFHHSNSWEARKACAKLAGKDLGCFIISPLVMSFGAFSCLCSIREIAFETFKYRILSKTESGAKIKEVSYELLDCALSSASFPVIKSAMVVKLVFAFIFYPGVHFRNPEKFHIDDQCEYYKREVENQWAKITKKTEKNHTELVDALNALKVKHREKITELEDTTVKIGLYAEETAILDVICAKKIYVEDDFENLTKFLKQDGSSSENSQDSSSG